VRPALGLAAVVALCAAVAAGCGVGPGDDAGEVELSVTRDYGSEVLVDQRDSISESDTVLRLLDRNAEVETRYGGGFVQSIDGLSGEPTDGRASDWFFYVNGIESPVGGAERHVTLQDLIASGRLQAGSRLEADYRGQHHTAELLADGQIRLAGQTHRTLSSAGGAVKRAVHGPGIPKSVYSTDGWVFWRATDAKAGDTTTLRVIRQRVAGDDTA